MYKTIGYADMEKYMADLRNRGIPGNIVQTELGSTENQAREKTCIVY